MSRQIQISVVRGQQLLQKRVLELGETAAVRLNTQPGVRYQLVDLATGLGPQWVLMRRRGKALVLDFMDDQGRADSVEIEAFFEGEPTLNAVVGKNAAGDWVAYEAHPAHGLGDVAEMGVGQSSLWSLGDSVVAIGSGAAGVPLAPFGASWGGMAAGAGLAGGAVAGAGADNGSPALSAADYLAAIRAAAEANTASVPLADFAAAGVVGVNVANVGLINSVLNGAAVGSAQLALVDDVNALVRVINALLSHASGNGGDVPTLEDVQRLGVSGLRPSNWQDFLDGLGGSGGIDSLADLQGAVDAVSNLRIEGEIVAGPVVDGHGLWVRVYDFDGGVLGSAAVDAQGRYSFDIESPYVGALLLKVYDRDSGSDYVDEALAQTQDLQSDLRALGWVDGPGRYVVNINPLTELAVRQLDMTGGDGGQASTNLSAGNWPSGDVSRDVGTVNARVAQAFGLQAGELLVGPVVPVIDRDGQPQASANAYGRALAAISGVERTMGVGTVAAVDMLDDAMRSPQTWVGALYELLAGASTAGVGADVMARQLGMSLDDTDTRRQAVWSDIYAAADGVVGGQALSLSAEQLALIGVRGEATPVQLQLLSSAVGRLHRAQVDSVEELRVGRDSCKKPQKRT